MITILVLIFLFLNVARSNIPEIDNSLPAGRSWFDLFRKVHNIWNWLQSQLQRSANEAQIFEIEIGIYEWCFKPLFYAFMPSILKPTTLQSSNTWNLFACYYLGLLRCLEFVPHPYPQQPQQIVSIRFPIGLASTSSLLLKTLALVFTCILNLYRLYSLTWWNNCK